MDSEQNGVFSAGESAKKFRRRKQPEAERGIPIKNLKWIMELCGGDFG